MYPNKTKQKQKNYGGEKCEKQSKIHPNTERRKSKKQQSNGNKNKKGKVLTYDPTQQ